MNQHFLTIMVIDDNPMLRAAYTAYLMAQGHPVIEASNGREALDLLRGGARPDLLFLDLSMPVMSGWEFRAVQRTDPRIGRIPVIVLSGDELDPCEYDVLACCQVLRKPSPIETIAKALERGKQCARRMATLAVA